MIYLFDENTSPKLTKVLRILKVPAKHVRDNDVAFAGIADDDWLPRVAARGWVLVTQDRSMLERERTAQVLFGAHVKAIFLPAGLDHEQRWGIVRWYLNYWPRVTENLAAALGKCDTGPWLVTMNGKLERVLQLQLPFRRK